MLYGKRLRYQEIIPGAVVVLIGVAEKPEGHINNYLIYKRVGDQYYWSSEALEAKAIEAFEGAQMGLSRPPHFSRKGNELEEGDDRFNLFCEKHILNEWNCIPEKLARVMKIESLIPAT